MSKLCTLIILSIFSLLCSAQTPLWLQQIGSSGQEGGGSMVIDDLGNIYVTGYFENNVNFSPDPSQPLSLSSQGMADIFIQKLDSEGNLIWVKRIGGNSFDYGLGLAYDPQGFLYITGLYNDNVDFDPGPGSMVLSSSGNYNTFILKLDTAGQFEWVRDFTGSAYCSPRSIYFDPIAGLFLTGEFQGNCNFDPNSTNGTTLSSNGNNDIFIAKLISNGNFGWAHGFGSTGSDRGMKVTGDSLSNIYCTGIFRGQVDFDPGPGSNPKGGIALANDIFLMKIDSLGNIFWTEAISAPDFQNVLDMAISGSEVILTGSFKGTVDFDFSTGVNQMTAQTSTDGFILNLDLDANFDWVKQLSSSSRVIAFNDNKEFYLGGGFRDTIDLDPGIDTFMLVSAGATDGYLGKYNDRGEFIEGLSYTGPAGEGISNLAIDPAQDVYTSGIFYGSTTFYSDSSYQMNRSTLGGDDIFIYKMKTCPQDTFFDTLYYCAPYPLANGDTLTAIDSTIYFIEKDQFRCDSTRALVLLYQALNTGIDLGLNQLSAQESGASYQWLSCNGASYSFNPADTNRLFSITQNGSYALVVRARGCIDTSACLNINNIGLPEVDQNSTAWFFPNPSINGEFQVEPLAGQKILSVKVINPLGQELPSHWEATEQRLRTEANPGTYWLQIKTAKHLYFQKILILRP